MRVFIDFTENSNKGAVFDYIRQCIKLFIFHSLARKEEFAGREHSYYQQIEGGHHRVEKRQIWTVTVSELPPVHNQSLWTGLKTVVMVVSERRLWNKTTTEVRLYLSSLASNAEKIAQAIRSHWGIENS